MHDIFNEKMKSAEIANKLGIETVTLRKYCLVLEDHGYVIDRNGKNREFTTKDFEVLSNMRYLIETAGMNREQSAKIIVARINSSTNDTENNETPTSVAISNSYNGKLLEWFKRYDIQQTDIHNNVLQIVEMMMSIQEQAVTTMKENEMLKGELKIIKEKLDNAVDYIQKQESEEKKKGLWRFLKGGV